MVVAELWHACRILTLCGVILSPLKVLATPNQVPFQGVIKSAGIPYTGTGYFKFAIIRDGQVAWANASPGDLTSEPEFAVPLQVTTGRYVIQLGDTSLPRMSSLTASVFSGDVPASLRVWFSTDEKAPFERLEPDQPISSVPYSMIAGLAESASTVPNGSITSAKLATTLVLESLSASALNGSNISGNGAGITGLNADQLTLGTVADARLSGNVPRLNLAQMFTGENVFSENLRVGAVVDTAVTAPGYGKALVLSGGPDVSPAFNTDNSDSLWLARYNAGSDATELRVSIGDNPGSAADKFVIGTATGSGALTTGTTWQPKFSVDAAGTAKVGANAEFYVPTAQQPLRVIAGTVRPDGVVVLGSGFSVGKNATGSYTITYSPPYPGGTVITVSPSSSAPSWATWGGQTGNSVVVTTYNASGLPTDTWFNFIVVGYP